MFDMIATPEIKITVDGLWIAGRPFTSSESIKVLVNYYGETPRLLPANPNAPEWRDVLIFDKTGIYALCDKQSSQILSMNFVWQPNEVPYPPLYGFKGKLELNNSRLTGQMHASQLPISGPIGIQRILGDRYVAEFSRHHLSLKFAKPKDHVGKKARNSTLAYLEFSYSEGSDTR